MLTEGNAMNCPQCQVANAPDAGFCSGCGARLAVAESAAPVGYGAPSGGGYPPPSGSYPPPSGSGYQQGGGYQGGSGYQGGPGYQQDAGYQQGQGQYQPPAGQPWQAPRSGGGLPTVNFDLNRATRVDKIVTVATFITMISIWMPWFTVSYLGASASGSGTTAHGWLWLEFILGLALIGYLVARVAWETLPFNVPVAHDRLLVVGTGVQLLLILIAFADLPSSGVAGVSVGWGFGAFLGLLAALVAAGPVLVPAFRSFRDSRRGTTGSY
jgi:hypothetical protein